MNRFRLLIVTAAFLGTACRDEQPAPPVPAQRAPQAEPAPSPATVPASKPHAALEIPTEEDFELEASEAITSKNLEAELDQLERELKGQ